MNYANKTVIVTGAGRGIGRAVAAAYAMEGATVVVAELDAALGQEAARGITAAGGQAEFVACDVSSEEQIVALVAHTAEKYGTVDILINNAGIADPHAASLYELSADVWDKVLNTNARSVFLATREAAKHMRSNPGGGSVVNLSSTRALMSEPDTEAYAASKGAITALTHAMAVTLGKDGITVNCISPGWIETGDYSELREIDHKQHPVGRVGKPEDIARACLYLTAPENNFITGAQLVIDGGMTRKMIYEP
ncbi:3-ketoacyl-ACP reductase [Paenibacillus sp. FSL R7-0273]|uniref:SDR family NAD(P)-dependent oxidoreductase n=1 Tax=Paenibacillus sp. FSL R7-0273 TaxID=1536772 RepID=UPI0004F8D13E|nr:glucose 1-dehydrogenase [Paenibacillus sp. FSL R7-0273]AIQ47520.1 3-ketoacyl-ACP reductase [Paenibacillus sp. FSL R7-0273]OMF95920.1 3-ketoacyl-ACP reductase [Paenibacillus sp. FSL R7-0273]